MMNLLTGTPALLLRVIVFYPLGWLLGLWLGPAATFNPDTGFLVLDLNALSIAVAALFGVGGSGLTFLWSRLAKGKGGAT